MLNHSRIQKIHDRSQDFVIESKFNNLVNPSTLSLDALKFLGTLVEDFQPLNILEFGSGLSTLFLCNILKKQGDGHLFSIENSTPHPPFMDYYSDDMVELIYERDQCIFELFNYGV